MSVLLLLFAAALQTSAASPEPEYEEVVVTATAGRVALVFDKATDGRLINCRVFKSSGVATVDARACTSLPDCVTSTKGQQFCGGEGNKPLMAVEPPIKPAEPKLGLGVTLKPDPPKVPAVGPLVSAETEDDPNRLSKLPPPPKADNGPPAITFSSGQADVPR